MLAKFYLKKRCKKVSCPIIPHISTLAYKHTLISSKVIKSVTKSLRFKITIMLLLVLQITVRMRKFSLNYVLCLHRMSEIPSKIYSNYYNILSCFHDLSYCMKHNLQHSAQNMFSPFWPIQKLDTDSSFSKHNAQILISEVIIVSIIY